MGEIIELKSDNLDKCFSFWDFQNDELKKNRITEEIDTDKRKMFVYLIDEDYVAGFSISTINENQAYFSYLVVREDFRNKGIGSFLIDYAVNYAKIKNFKEILLQVDIDNARAKLLYERKGFVPINENISGRIRLLKTI